MEKPRTRAAGARSQPRRQDFSREAAAPPWTHGPGTPRVAASAGKRAFDVIVSLAAIVFFLPVFLIASVALFSSGRGSVLVRHKRTGLGGAPVDVLAFRVLNARPAEVADKRLTRLGGFLRRTGLEALPQFLNVIRGDLSLVGPEPRALAVDAFYSRRIKDYGRRFRARPGMTGLAQIACPEQGDDAVAYARRSLEYDNAYIDDWSVGLDCKILLQALAGALCSRPRS